MVKDSACNEGDQGLIPGTGRFPGEGKGYPLQYSCLENSTKRGAWQATVLGVAKSRTQLNDFIKHLWDLRSAQLRNRPTVHFCLFSLLGLNGAK